MNIAVYIPQAAHERSFILDFADATRRLGHTVYAVAATPLLGSPWPDEIREVQANADVHLKWGTHPPKPPGRSIYFELAWLPRWSYQVSPTGINALHHRAGDGLPELTATLYRYVERTLESVRLGIGAPRGWRYLDIDAPPMQYCPSEFFLAPLQMEQDTNMASVPEELRTNQGFVDYVSALDLPAPVVFKQHPHSGARPQLDLVMKRPGDKVYLHKDAHVYSYLKHPGCLGVVTLNSNAANDALLWDVPVVTVGEGIWPRGVFLESFFRSYLEFWTLPEQKEKRLAYVANLLDIQWPASHAGLLSRVEKKLALAMELSP